MLRNEVIALMENLKLKGMQEVYDEVVSSGRRQRAIPEKVILELLKAEAAERRLRSIRYRLGQARFPMLRGMASGLRRQEDDHRHARSHHAPLRDPGNRKRLVEDEAPFLLNRWFRSDFS
jgi:hypothetical protein